MNALLNSPVVLDLKCPHTISQGCVLCDSPVRVGALSCFVAAIVVAAAAVVVGDGGVVAAAAAACQVRPFLDSFEKDDTTVCSPSHGESNPFP